MDTMNKSRNARVEQHLSIVDPVARYYSANSGQDQEDLRQVGLLGLLRAAERFEPNRSVPFAAFAKPHIRGAILHYLRDGAALVRIPRRDQAVESDESALMNAAKQRRSLITNDLDHLQSMEPVGTEHEQLEHSMEVMTALADLDRPERQAVTHVILKGQSLRQAGRCIGVSAMTVQRRLKRGLNSLRHELRTQPWPG
ncbi:sigma-70 family RNA polymerase sigma factor [Synechococcus sp. NOUM97013]|uniref:sigma-70 family RNA polymerase sigma factor n=1 Tax=Synechococcus sp. NOUM97013 TaxID=1442555 RepID=UPI00164591DE|nr:sigma-70 family RNA polymerase sigma factor [Synechococcus sp. NOUM97013]QNI73475.1 RNA polymerase sigma factor/ type III [Synechococcus sp. NOUM97013]